MFEFICENAGTIAVLLLLAVVLFFAVRSIIKNKKSGKCSSCSSCEGCSFCDKNKK